MKALNNKGYTLVELLLSVAILAIVMAQVANIMYSTTLIYKNGNRDISLQTEAQQIVALVEELVMDCDGKVTFNSTSNTITIDNKASWMTDYTITLNDDKLYLAAAGGNPQLMADGVKSIDMDLSNYEHESKVYFTVEMENESSEYASSKDIYLRNHIGKNDSGIGQYSKPQEDDSAIETLNGADVYPMEILRFKNYDLTTEIPEDVRTKYNLKDDCSFQPVIWGTKPDGTEGYIVRDVYPYYEIDATGTIISSNQDLNKSYKGTETLGTEDGNDGYVLFQSKNNPNFLLKCYSVDVCIGTQAYKNTGTESISLSKVSDESCSILSYETCYSGSKVPMYIGVSGISLEACKSFSLTPYIKFTADKLDKSGKSDMNFYKITYNDNIVTPTADVILKNYVVDSEDDDTVYGNAKYNKNLGDTPWKGYTNNSVCVALGSGFESSSQQIKNFNSKQIAIYVAKGYDDASASTFGTNFDNKASGTEEYYPFKISFTSGKVQYGADKDKEGMFIDKNSNCFVVATNMFDFSQGKLYSDDCGMGTASKFYEMGGEIFFDLEVQYDNGFVLGAPQSASFDGKVLLNPYDSKKDHASTKSMSSDASKKMSEAVVSGMKENVATVEYDVLKEDGTKSGDKVSVPVYSNSTIK